MGTKDDRWLAIMIIIVMLGFFGFIALWVLTNTSSINKCIETHGTPITSGGQFRECKR